MRKTVEKWEKIPSRFDKVDLKVVHPQIIFSWISHNAPKFFPQYYSNRNISPGIPPLDLPPELFSLVPLNSAVNISKAMWDKFGEGKKLQRGVIIHNNSVASREYVIELWRFICLQILETRQQTLQATLKNYYPTNMESKDIECRLKWDHMNIWEKLEVYEEDIIIAQKVNLRVSMRTILLTSVLH
jgi:hypothetical protein